MKLIQSLLLSLFCLNYALGADTPPAAASDNKPSGESALTAKQAEMVRLFRSLKPQEGNVLLPGNKAKLSLPDDLHYLSPDDSMTVLKNLWGNPLTEKPLGMIVPANFNPFDSTSWAAVINYTDEGHVHDADAAKINYSELLASMQKSVRENNPERVNAGYDSIELAGWATSPHYDAASHKLYWAKDLKFGQSEEHTLNYNIRVLGRTGYLELNLVGRMQDLAAIEKATPHILEAVEFAPGNRYADFSESTDKVATYGIAALIAGGVAAKAGFFKVLLMGILAAKKFIVVGVLAVVGFVKKLFNRKKDSPLSPNA